MKSKPLSINLIAISYLLAPAVNILQMAWVNQWPLSGPRGILERLNSWEWVILGSFWVAAFGIWRVARWGFLFFIALSSYLLIHNTYIYLTSAAYPVYLIMLFHLVNLGLVGFFLQKHIMSPYFNPKLKWWERDARYRTNLSAQVRIKDQTIETQLLDISTGGCFVGLSPSVHPGDIVWVTVQLSDHRIHLPGKVMWTKFDDPVGFGLMFMGLESADKKTLKKIIDYLANSVQDGLQSNEGLGKKSAS
ncbi:MAG: PilZ domain-containing protein [Oligoflexia bacterium]|nr:PilZ domain-containing protein [Oligoflexia bacterium]